MQDQQRLAGPPIVRLPEMLERLISARAEDAPLLRQKVRERSVRIVHIGAPAPSGICDRLGPSWNARRRPVRSARCRQGEPIRLAPLEDHVGEREKVGGPLEELVADRAPCHRLPDGCQRRLLDRRGEAHLMHAPGRGSIRSWQRGAAIESRERVVSSPGGAPGGLAAAYPLVTDVTSGSARRLVDRRSERDVLDRLLATVRGGQSAVLSLVGPPGIGKTALLEYAIEAARGFRVARAVGVEWEMELPFAALQQLCAPMLDRLERLPGPQRNALGVAFGLSPGATRDPFLVGLAALSLLSAVGDEQPLLCVVDDAQWLDRASAQALAFVARRLLAERVSLVIATRAPIEELRGLPELGVEGLRNADARTLLASVLRVPLTEAVGERILAESRGNPLALLELPRGLTTVELGSVFGASDAPALSGRIEESLRRRLGELPTDTQRLLLLAAAEPVGDPALLWRAAGQLGIGLQAAAAAESEELLQVAARVTFPHPSVRSAVYRAAAPQERRAVHRALAEATDPELDP